MELTNALHQQSVLGELTQELERATKAGESEGYRAQLQTAIRICREHLGQVALNIDNSKADLKAHLATEKNYKTPERLQAFAQEVKK